MTVVLDPSPTPTLTWVDGIRVVWAYSPGPRSHAGLAFRVGQADETLTNRGITHLLEHLVLAGTDVSVDHNGQTDLFTTTFTVSGTLAEIDTHLARVAANLTALPESRIEVEKQILAAEEGGRANGIFEALALYRYGATGIGLTYYPEWGLSRIGASELSQWAGRYFTADNAVLMVVGPQRPEELTWRLPMGSPQPPPAPADPFSHLPGFAFDRVAGPALMAELPRSPAAVAFAAVLDRELLRRVRGEHGLAYRTSAGYLPVALDRAVVLAHTDAVPGKAQEAVEAFLDVVFEMAADGPDPRLLADFVAARETAFADQQAASGMAYSAAREMLLGEPALPDHAAIRAEFAALTPSDVQAVAAEVLGSAMVLLPPETRAIERGGFTPVGPADSVPVTGQSFPVPVPTEAGAAPNELIVGSTGVSHVRGGQTVTISFADLAVLLRWPDGGRLLVARSGDMIQMDRSVVDPARIGLIDEAAGPDRWIDRPARQEPESTEAPTSGQAPLTKVQRFVVRPLRALGVLLVSILLFATVWPVDAAGSMVPPGDKVFMWVTVMAVFADNWLYARRARRRNYQAGARAQQDPAHV